MKIHRPRRRPLTRLQRDTRLGYSALVVSAIAFVMVLVASFVVIKVAPDTDLRVPSARSATQPVVKHPPIRPLATRTPPTQAAGGVEAGAGTPGATDAAASPVVTPGGPQPAPTPDPVPQPTPTEPDGPGPGGPETPTPPPPDEPTRPGPTSSLVDPVVEAITGTLDQVSGGATQPVTGPVGDLSDDVTDVVDGLLGHR